MFKKTEVGSIPQEWDVKSLGELFDFGGGFSASREQLSSMGHCYLHYGDIHKSAESYIDVQAQFIDIPKLDVSLTRVPSHSLLKDGDVVFVDASEDDEGASKHVVVVNKESVPFISGLHTIAGTSKTDLLDNLYKRHCFQTASIKKQFLYYCVGTKVTGISKANIRKVLIPLPSLPEQRAIAEALSDVDALIDSLDKLIAKKRDIKKGAMQELLTGRKRLPGFAKERSVMPIGRLTECIAGGTPSTLVPEYWGGAIRWMSSGELNKKHISEVQGRITEQGLNNSNASLIPEKSVLIGLAGQGKTRGTVAMNFVTLCTNQSIAAILPSESFMPEFLYYNLDSRYDELRAMSSGEGGRGGLNLRIIKSIPVNWPDLDEQKAIAQVLSDMDAEISALEMRREKTVALKQGMMQALLTGRTRLVPRAETTAGHNWQFNEAVIIGVLSNRFGTIEWPLPRKRCTKLTYLFHRHAEHRAEGYLKKAAGPYNPATRYKGPEDIAQRNGYVRLLHNGKYQGFVAADNCGQAETYFRKWYGEDAFDWLEKFHYRKTDELELLATVDMAMEDLRAEAKPVDMESVKRIIGEHPEWQAKLEREVFSDANIERAIQECSELFADSRNGK